MSYILVISNINM